MADLMQRKASVAPMDRVRLQLFHQLPRLISNIAYHVSWAQGKCLTNPISAASDSTIKNEKNWIVCVSAYVKDRQTRYLMTFNYM